MPQIATANAICWGSKTTLETALKKAPQRVALEALQGHSISRGARI